LWCPPVLVASQDEWGKSEKIEKQNINSIQIRISKTKIGIL
jgi:hypothetical protein